ncbi:MAG: hypothetical protein ACD_2C00025G0011 [uncultured bacterium (gcode 4)]|uniref:Uncharacterized protein n=1 Tax=uncultured bacterium (gcode 4) TaxID=1234023 RepID=K2H309_9BACT|nr:MAG: hypothetical protein ACD_2C00025G0011 [uncultured bacterium (gcode 4)]
MLDIYYKCYHLINEASRTSCLISFQQKIAPCNRGLFYISISSNLRSTVSLLIIRSSSEQSLHMVA